MLNDTLSCYLEKMYKARGGILQIAVILYIQVMNV